MGRKEDMEQLLKSGFIREKKQKVPNIKLHGKEVPAGKLSEILVNRKVIIKGYDYVIVSKNKD